MTLFPCLCISDYCSLHTDTERVIKFVCHLLFQQVKEQKRCGQAVHMNLNRCSTQKWRKNCRAFRVGGAGGSTENWETFSKISFKALQIPNIDHSQIKDDIFMMQRNLYTWNWQEKILLSNHQLMGLEKHTPMSPSQSFAPKKRNKI